MDGTLGLNEGILMTNGDGVLTFCNSRACDVLGWDRNEVMGHALSSLNSTIFGRDAVMQSIASAREQGSEFRQHLSGETNGRRVHIDLRATIRGDSAVVLLEDSTQAYEMEEGLACFVGPTIVDQLRSASLSSWQPTRTKLTVVGIEPSDFSYFANASNLTRSATS